MDPAILSAVLGVLWFITCGLAALVWKNLQAQIAELRDCLKLKVDKEIYDLAQSSLIGDVRELKDAIGAMTEKLEEIRLYLAEDKGAKIEREKKKDGE